MAEGLFLPPRGENLSREEPGGISPRQGLREKGMRRGAAELLGEVPTEGLRGARCWQPPAVITGGVRSLISSYLALLQPPELLQVGKQKQALGSRWCEMPAPRAGSRTPCHCLLSPPWGTGGCDGWLGLCCCRNCAGASKEQKHGCERF